MQTPMLLSFLLAGFAGSSFAQPSSFFEDMELAKTRAVVVGVSHYHDADIPDLKLAHEDAESFAAFLMSEGGGRLSQSDIVLLTNEQATTARFATALDWLFEQAADGQAIIYFAGYGDVKPGSEQFPGFFLLNDAALSPIIAGAFNFPAYFGYHAKGKQVAFTVIANTYPLVLSQHAEQRHFLLNYLPKSEGLEADFVNNLVGTQTFQSSSEEISRSKTSQSNLLLDGLLGLADKDANGEVTLRELARFFKDRPAAPETWPSQLSVLTSRKNQPLSVVDGQLLQSLTGHTDGMFPAIIYLETTKSEDALLAAMDERVLHLYQDFVVAIKLGHLLEPPGRSAASLYDSLLLAPGLQPLHGKLRRKLAAALLDETQQALNAYLQTDVREIVRRGKDKRYRLYPHYLSQSLRLLGEKHYMRDMLMVKQHYFEGLLLRFDAENRHDTVGLGAAMQHQQLARSIEPEAAFVINEIGLVHHLLGSRTEALVQFRLAAELSPNWSIPHSNICYELTLGGDPAEAIGHGRQAILLSPRNVIAFNNLGLALLKSGSMADAEQAFAKAVSLDPVYAESYYNLARLKSLQAQPGQALEWLEQALQKGFDNLPELRLEPDLAEVRRMEQFGPLIDRYLAESKKW